MTFEFLSNFIRKHGNNYPDPEIISGCWVIKFLFVQIFYEVSWMIDHNVEDITFRLFGNNIYRIHAEGKSFRTLWNGEESL